MSNPFSEPKYGVVITSKAGNVHKYIAKEGACSSLLNEWAKYTSGPDTFLFHVTTGVLVIEFSQVETIYVEVPLVHRKDFVDSLKV
jgi:hypothetical protein